MQADNQPVRPPRMSRSSAKESSTGLLMSVIRSLTSSRDVADRDREKTNLEREYRESDKRLDKLVLNHHKDLTSVMQAFSKITVRLGASRDRLSSVREKLITCQKLLHCKRDELKKLWLESVENKHVLELLDRVEAIAKVPNDVRNFINKKHYLHATKLLVESLSSLEGNLKTVEALREVKTELSKEKEEMYNVLVDELHKHIYVKSTAEVLKRFKRQGSERKNIHNKPEGTPSRKASVADILSPAVMQNSALPKKRNAGSISQVDLPGTEIHEDVNITDPEEDTRHFITIIIECLALLNKIPEAIECIKDRGDKELVNIVKRTGKELLNDASFLVTKPQQVSIGHISFVLRSSLILRNSENKAHLLQELLELLFQQFRCIVQVHDTIVLVNLRRIETQRGLHGETVQIYNMADVWSKIQAVLQLVTDLYLDITGSNSVDKNGIMSASIPEAILAHSTPSVADLNSYFIKKKVGLSVTVGSTFGKIKKTPLFRFDLSSHAMSLNAYLQEQKEAMKEKAELAGTGAIDSIDFVNDTEHFIVCHPAPENIVIMFNSLMKFISEIDDELNLEEGNHCPLHSYVTSCSKYFLNQINVELERMLEMANKNLDSWKIISNPTEAISHQSQPRPLLQSTLTIERAIQDLKNLMYSLPLYADEFLTFICNILSNYKETCLAAYRGVVQPEPEDKRIISATWAKDEDISRFLKSLPNWASLQRAQKNPQMRNLTSGTSTSLSFDESPEEVRLRNMRESEILTSNLTQDTLIPDHEILSDVNQLRALAQLQESMEWLGSQIQVIAQSLPRFSSADSFLSANLYSTSSKHSSELAPLSDVSIATLNQLSRDFEELAETCLLVLHLEVRVHCFYYLLPVAIQSAFSMGLDTQEPDPEVIKLNKDLTNIDEALSVSLQPWKLRYIFEGVGHLVATILINCATTIKRINQNGVKKMCRNIFAIQQSLTSITMTREVALDYARQYYELFCLTPEEILSVIVERGPQFQVIDYSNAINLLHRSLPGRDSAYLESILKKLAEILNEVAVSV